MQRDKSYLVWKLRIFIDAAHPEVSGEANRSKDKKTKDRRM